MSGGANMKTITEKNEFIELRSKGLSYNKIAEKMKVSKPTLLKWGQEFKRHIRNTKPSTYSKTKNAARLLVPVGNGRIQNSIRKGYQVYIAEMER